MANLAQNTTCLINEMFLFGLCTYLTENIMYYTICSGLYCYLGHNIYTLLQGLFHFSAATCSCCVVLYAWQATISSALTHISQQKHNKSSNQSNKVWLTHIHIIGMMAEPINNRSLKCNRNTCTCFTHTSSLASAA